MRNGVLYVQNLNEKEISAVTSLIKFYNEEKGIYFKFDPGFLTNPDEEANHVLFFENDMLTGYMSIDCYNGEEVEAAPVVDKEDVFIKMHQCLIMDAKDKGKQKLLYIVDRKFDFLGNCLNKIDMPISFSELRMNLDQTKFKPIENCIIEIRDAEVNDKRAIFELDKDAFNESGDLDDEIKIKNVELSLIKVAILNNEVIGKVRVFESNGNAGIYGFVVYPHLRGKGYGKAILSEIISMYQKNGSQKIFLEVETENAIAVHLYHSVGFVVQSTFDYYELNI
jgi:ribosomal protein S18 acetylase RimI-like enzyme